MTNLYVAADFFFDRWDDPAKRQLWLVLQPYFNLAEGGFDRLRQWIAQPAGTHVERVHLASGLDPNGLVPVPLPPDHEVLTAALFASDAVDSDPPLYSVEINRRTQYRVTDTQRLFALNHRVDEARPGEVEDTSVAAYQILFWEQLREAAAPGGLDGEDLCDWLRNAFEVGQRVYFDDNCIGAVDPLFDARQPFDDGIPGASDQPLLASNRHCLLGLMLPLGNDIDTLSKVRATTLTVKDVGRLDLTAEFSGGRLPRMFETIPQLSIEVPTAQSWDRSVEKRVHAIPIAETYAPHLIHADGSWLWRQHRGADTSEALPTTRWAEFERLVLRYGLKGDEAAIPADIASIKQFLARPEVSLDVQFEIYRHFPLRILDASSAQSLGTSAEQLAKRVVVAIRPASHEVARFRALMTRDEHRDLLRQVHGEPAPDGTKLLLYRHAFAAPSDSGRLGAHLLSPAWVAPFAFPWLAEDSYELLACFDLENDVVYSDEDTLRKALIGPGLLRLQLPTLLPLDLVGYDASRPGQIASLDPFGPRWDYWHSDNPQQTNLRNLPDFDALSFEDLSPAAIERIAQLIVSCVELDRRAFEWSQSARRIEGVFRVASDVVDVDQDTPVDAFTATQAHSEDRLNFNTVNVVETRSGRWANQPTVKRFLNHSSEMPAVHWAVQDLKVTDPWQPNKRVTYVFQPSFTDRTTAPLRSAGGEVWRQVRWQIGAEDGENPVETRQFYSAVYGFAGEKRDLAMHLQHTYGSCIELVPIQDVPDILDEPIAVCADVAYRPLGDTQSSRKLWQIKFVADSHSAARAILLLDHELLSTKWVDEPENESERNARNNAHNSAWQSVAEMAHGGGQHSVSLRLVAELFRFDVYESLRHARPSIAGGLVARVEECGEDTTARIVEAMKQWLEKGQGETSFTLDLPSSWMRDYHAVRFRFEHQRAAKMVPTPFSDAQACPYALHQRLQRLEPGQDPAALFGHEGLLTLDVGSEALKWQLKLWVDTLNHAGGYISPLIVEGAAARHADLKATLGTINTQVAPALRLPPAIQEADDAWIAPVQTVIEGGAFSLSYCPVGFEPLALDPFLSEQTSPMIRRYFSTLQAIIEMRAHALARMPSDTLLRLFESWGDFRRNNVMASAYAALTRAAAETVYAIPDPEAAGLHPVVRDFAARINRRDAGLGRQFHAWLQHLFRLAPGGFDELKAIGLLEVGGEAFTTPLRADFHALSLHKRVRASDAAPVVSVHGIGSPGFPEREIGRLAFVDLLPDKSYDNAFQIEAIHAETVERVLEQHQPDANGELPSDVTISLHDEEVHVPENAPVPLGHQPYVFLASRRPVDDPSLGFIAAESLAIDPNQDYLLPAFLKGLLQQASRGEPAVKRIDLVTFGRVEPQHTDEIVMAGLFAVSGDEETDEQGVEAFANDCFYVLQAADAAGRTAAIAADGTLEPIVVKAFEALAELRQVEQIDAVDALMSAEALRFVGSAVGRERTLIPPPGPHSSSVRFRLSTIDGRPRIQVAHLAEGVRGKVSLFHQQGDSATSTTPNERTRFFVLIELIAPIWSRQTLSLVQTRNEPSQTTLDQRRFFAPRFTTVSNRIGDAVARRPVTSSRSGETRYRKIVGLKKSTHEFCATLLADEIRVDDSFGGKQHRLMVTIKEDSAVRLPSADGDDRWLSNGSFAIRTVEIAPRTNAPDSWREPVEWFPDEMALRYRIDFEWRDNTNNDLLLRIEDVPVELLQPDGP